MTDLLWQMNAVATAAAIRKRERSCREVVEAHLERMQAVNPALNAVTVDLSGPALETAAQADAAIARGDALGPLHGVPVTIKENVDQRGAATTNGVAAFAAAIARDDSPVVANLKRAGAVIIGRTNTPEFSLRWFTQNALRGLTVNPWRPEVTCGGSSGGAAASVAMGIGAIAHGNDLGGSLRYPAYCCGLASIRPSLGRVPAYNPSAPEERPPSMLRMSVQGPIAREVKDVRVALAAMAVRDDRDPLWRSMPMPGEPVSAPVRVAFCTDPGGHGVDAAVAGAVEKAAAILAGRGYMLEEVKPPAVDEIAGKWGALLSTEIRVMLASAIRQHGSEDTQRSLEYFVAHYGVLDLEGYMRTLADRNRLMREWAGFLGEYPLVLAPVSQAPPFPVNEDLISQSRMSELLTAQQMMVCVNFLGLPAAAIGTGIVDGAPIGVQIIGRHGRDDLCLDAAEAIEASVGVLTRELWSRG